MSIRHLTNNVHRTQYPTIDPTNPVNSATGKTVLISGGASGIGYAIARGFSAAGAARMILLARRQDALDTASTKLTGENAAAQRDTAVWTYRADISDQAAVEAVFDAIRKRLDDGAASDDDENRDVDIDVLVTSAAHIADSATTVELDPGVVRDAYATNVLGNLSLVRAFLAPDAPAIPLATFGGYVKDTSGARPLPPATAREKVVLDVSSATAYVLMPGQSLYASSKLAFTNTMRHLASEVRGLPIRVHSFHPGGVFTVGAQKSGLKEDSYPWDDESLPAGFAVWLASPAAAFLHGRYLQSHWDVEELVAMKARFEEDPDFCCITLKF